MEKQEKIISPAVRMKFTEPELCQEIWHDAMCISYKDHLISDIQCLYEDALWDIEEEIHGFMTSKRRFVDPIEAQKIAIAAGQYECPNRAIKSLEEAIENRWFEINHTRNNMVFQTLKNYNRQDNEKIQQLKAGYLGYALRVEDLY